MAKKHTLTATYESLPKLAKILIQLFLGAVVGGIYRIVKFFETGNTVTLIAGILTLCTGFGNLIAWAADLVTEFLYGKITLFAD